VVIKGIGVDAVYIRRMQKWLETTGLLERYFNNEELSVVLEKGNRADMSLAARFAAKEAFGKALGTGLRGIMLKDIMVRNKHSGQPEILVSGTALSALENSGAGKIHVSLTHEKDYAIAMVVLENEL
jgi:holo-[acyl-carrier protein] synthase